MRACLKVAWLNIFIDCQVFKIILITRKPKWHWNRGLVRDWLVLLSFLFLIQSNSSIKWFYRCWMRQRTTSFVIWRCSLVHLVLAVRLSLSYPVCIHNCFSLCFFSERDRDDKTMDQTAETATEIIGCLKLFDRFGLFRNIWELYRHQSFCSFRVMGLSQKTACQMVSADVNCLVLLRKRPVMFAWPCTGI